MEDFQVVSSGANYASRNDLRNGFYEVISFVKSVDQTNVILVGIPHRYDLGSSQYNSEIEIYNRKLDKLAKIFTHVNVVKVDNNRQQYTTHGQHLNGLGKELLSSNLLLQIYSTLEKASGPTIALAWRDNYSQGNSLHTILDNQDMITNSSIRDKSINIPNLGKDCMAGGAVDDNTSVVQSRMPKIRTSKRTKKARY
jgi:hypothetical protein